MWLPHLAKQAEWPHKPEWLEGEGLVPPGFARRLWEGWKLIAPNANRHTVEGGVYAWIVGFACTCHSSNLHSSLECYVLFPFRYIDVETEAQRGGVTRPWPHSQQNADPKQSTGLGPHPLWLFLTLRYAELFPGLLGTATPPRGPLSRVVLLRFPLRIDHI